MEWKVTRAVIKEDLSEEVMFAGRQWDGCLGKATLNAVLLTRLSEIASIQNEQDSVALVTLSKVMGSPQG